MSKAIWEQRSSQHDRREIAKKNILALEFMFWESIGGGGTWSATGHLVDLIIHETGNTVSVSEEMEKSGIVPCPYGKVETVRATKAISLLLELPERFGYNGGAPTEVLEKLWGHVIHGWRITEDEEAEREFGKYVLSVVSDDSRASIQCYDLWGKTLRTGLESVHVLREPRAVSKISRLLAYAAETTKKEAPYPEKTIRILNHAYGRHEDPAKILERFMT